MIRSLITFIAIVATSATVYAQCPGGCPTSFGNVRYSALSQRLRRRVSPLERVKRLPLNRARQSPPTAKRRRFQLRATPWKPSRLVPSRVNPSANRNRVNPSQLARSFLNFNRTVRQKSKIV